MPVCKVTNHVQDRLGELRKRFSLSTQLDTRNEVIEHLLLYFDQLESIRKSHNFKTIEEVFRRYESMEKENEENDAELEIEKQRRESEKRLTTSQFNKIEQSIPELEKHIRESIIASKNSLTTEIKKLEDLANRLRLDIKESQQPQKLPEPPFDPDIFEVFKKLSSALAKGDDNRFLVYLMHNYDPELFQTRYKALYDKYLG